MTCIIAKGGRRGFICADRRITSSTGERCQPQHKVWRSPTGWIVGVAGGARGIAKVRRAVLAGFDAPDALVEAVGDDAQALALCPRGRLFEISEGDVIPLRGRWAALRCIGSGGDIARGFLEGKPLSEANAVRAQALAARERDDCGSGWDLERR